MEDKVEEITGAAKQVAVASEGMEQHSIEGNEVIGQIINQMSLIKMQYKICLPSFIR